MPLPPIMMPERREGPVGFAPCRLEELNETTAGESASHRFGGLPDHTVRRRIVNPTCNLSPPQRRGKHRVEVSPSRRVCARILASLGKSSLQTLSSCNLSPFVIF